MIKGLRNILKRSKTLVIQIIILFCVIFSYVVLVNGEPINFTLDFETGDLRGWTKTGNAFDYQPTLNDNPAARHRGQPSNHQGRYWIGTYERYQGTNRQKPGDIQGDMPTGTLTSAPFTIPSGKLSFLVGGGSGFETRVEFVIVDVIEQQEKRGYHASGRNTETMHRVTWDLTPYAGKTGKIRIVDESSQGWGHINVDDFRFTTVPDVTIPVIPAFPLEQKVEVPDLVRRNVSEAESILNRVKLRLGEITKKPSNQKPGTILRQSPAAHSKAERGTSVNIWVAEKELVEVPNLVRHHIDEAESILREFRLQLGDITKRASDNKEGTILRQEPSAGTGVPVGNPVNLWISSKREKPVAKINPAHIRVTQGEKAVFESQSTPEGVIRERWRGPRSQTGEGRNFEVRTDQLNPGQYEIVLLIMDRREQSDKALATLEVAPRLVKYKVGIEADANRIKQNQSIRFRALLSPRLQNVEYRFNFGDGTRSGWTVGHETEHAYMTPGSYQVFVAVRSGARIITESRAVQVEVTPVESAPIRRNVFLEADKHRVAIDEVVIFRGYIRPPLGNVMYQFNFGDQWSDWTVESELQHTYLSPGIYHAFVIVKKEGKIIAESRPIDIEIYRVHLPPGDRARRESVPGTDGRPGIPTWLKWAGIIAGLGAVFGAGYYLSTKVCNQKKEKHLEPSIKIRSHKDIGSQLIESETPIKSDFEVRLRPVLDHGKQEIETGGSLIMGERRENE